MNRRELIAAIAAHTDAEAKTVDAVLRGFTDVVCATVAKGDPVVLTGFAKFAKIQTKARMGRNPATGEAIKIKASKKARITPLKGFKDIVLGAAPAPKLTKAAPAKAVTAKPVSKAPARTTAARTTPAKAPVARTRTTAAKAPATRATATKAATTRRAPAKSTTKR
ncbi:MAG: DNA-binding protein HU-beta [Actinomycetota bacterium]|jgi:DNA-binding protein HU-beta|nr:DNA-binding protein HU-beta [Actinomycetota bacterium]MDQ1504383.1 DNA-binding protein HU-beta [Actinomycetota bacterium]